MSGVMGEDARARTTKKFLGFLVQGCVAEAQISRPAARTSQALKLQSRLDRMRDVGCMQHGPHMERGMRWLRRHGEPVVQGRGHQITIWPCMAVGEGANLSYVPVWRGMLPVEAAAKRQKSAVVCAPRPPSSV